MSLNLGGLATLSSITLSRPGGDLKQSVERLRNMAKEDGTTVTISAGGRSVTL